jgi:hypothetical protein
MYIEGKLTSGFSGRGLGEMGWEGGATAASDLDPQATRQRATRSVQRA